MSDTYKGQCFCGAVEVSVSGPPQVMGFCHCDDCRAWSASPVNGFSIWSADNVTVTKGNEHIATYCKTENSHRKFCKECGGHIMSDHPGGGIVDVYASVLPGLKFEPSIHVYYGEKIMSVPDGLPKFKDVPAEMGGSGDMLPD